DPSVILYGCPFRRPVRGTSVLEREAVARTESATTVTSRLSTVQSLLNLSSTIGSDRAPSTTFPDSSCGIASGCAIRGCRHRFFGGWCLSCGEGDSERRYSFRDDQDPGGGNGFVGRAHEIRRCPRSCATLRLGTTTAF